MYLPQQNYTDYSEGAKVRLNTEAHAAQPTIEFTAVALDIPMDRAQDLLIAIAKGAVPHVTISY
jgi:hypothetical protein